MRVQLIAAMTVCGRISPVNMGSMLDRRFLEKARQDTCASLMGAETFRGDDPEMRVLNGKLPAQRIRAIISASGDIVMPEKKLFQSGPNPYIFVSNQKKNQVERLLASKANIIGVPSSGKFLSLPHVIEVLQSLGVKSLLVEGGAALNYSCLQQGIVDELLLTLTPYISGDKNAVSLAEGPEPLGNPFVAMELLHCHPATTGELFLHYKVNKEAWNGKK